MQKQCFDEQSTKTEISRHYFILNPNAGKRKRQKKLKQQILDYIRKNNIDAEIYETKYPGDGARFVNAIASQVSGCRFYACGGDGTLGEIAQGVFGTENQFAAIPIGTGNDFVRNFEKCDFFDLDSQINGKNKSIDVIKGSFGICINMVNMGFDALCAKRAHELRYSRFIPSSFSYIAGVIANLVTMPTIKADITFDNNESLSGEFLLCAVANGKFCGGGFCAASEADTCDGYMDVLCIRPVTRRKFMSLIMKYRNGTLLSSKGIDGIVEHRKCKNLSVVSDENFAVSCDGEISMRTSVDFEISPLSITFSVPEIYQ